MLNLALSKSRPLHFPVQAGSSEDLLFRCCLHIRQEAERDGTGFLAVFSANTAVWAKQTTEQEGREQALHAPLPILRKPLWVRKYPGGEKVTVGTFVYTS